MNDIIIIGAGLAGLSAAITCAENDVNSILVSTMPSERSQSVMAEGGINAALNTKGEDDSIDEHYSETISAGARLADPNAVYGLVESAPAIVKRLLALGVVFNMSGRSDLDLRGFGGQKKMRTVFSQSSTGKQIMTALIQEVRKYEAQGKITRYSHHSFQKLSVKNGRCVGCIVLDNYSEKAIAISGDAVIIASGGINGLFECTTGSEDNTGMVTAELFRCGIPIANGEFIQYHPTTTPCNGKNILISEATRSEGARLFVYRNEMPWYFMEEKYPALGNLMPRDIIAREMWELEQTYLDMTGISQEVFDTKLSGTFEDCLTYLHIDPRTKPVPVMPGIHYFMGGICVDENHATILSGLYAAGECCCQYHGANRLGGNSMLGAIHGGTVAANAALSDKNSEKGDSFHFIEDDNTKLKPDDIKKLRHIMSKCLGIVRCKTELEAGISEIDELHGALPLLGKAILLSALKREESRGAHYRSDFPVSNDDSFRKITIAQYDGRDIVIRYNTIPERR